MNPISFSHDKKRTLAPEDSQEFFYYEDYSIEHKDFIECNNPEIFRRDFTIIENFESFLDYFKIKPTKYNNSFFDFKIHNVNKNYTLDFSCEIGASEIGILVKKDDEICIEANFSQTFTELKNVNAAQNISGTELMKIWEKLCYLLQPEYVALSDRARIVCKQCKNEKSHIKLRLWRVFGNKVLETGSWYENFGYRASDFDKENYQSTVNYISMLTLGKIKDIFKNFDKSSLLIDNCVKVFGINENDLLSVLIKKIDELRVKLFTDEEHELYHEFYRLMTLKNKSNESTSCSDFELYKRHLGILRSFDGGMEKEY